MSLLGPSNDSHSMTMPEAFLMPCMCVCAKYQEGYIPGLLLSFPDMMTNIFLLDLAGPMVGERFSGDVHVSEKNQKKGFHGSKFVLERTGRPSIYGGHENVVVRFCVCTCVVLTGGMCVVFADGLKISLTLWMAERFCFFCFWSEAAKK